MKMSIDEAKRKIWSAIQCISPSVTMDEIGLILREFSDAPTAEENDRKRSYRTEE